MRVSTNKLQNAIYDIFGKEQNIWNLSNLPDIALLKKKFYRRAMSCHPDRSQIVGRTSSQLTEEFKSINASYGLLQGLINDREVSETNFSSAATSYSRESEQDNKTNSRKYKKGESKTFWNNIGLPSHKLRFCQFLFYRGLIDWKTIIDALVWQSDVRPKVGKIAVNLGFLTAEDVVTILNNRNVGDKFCQSAINQGKLSHYQSSVIMGSQKRYDAPVGRFFIEMELFSVEEIDKALDDMKLHNHQFSVFNLVKV